MENFEHFIFKNQVIGFHEKPVALASGRESSWYVNWRKITADAFLMDQLCDFILAFLKTNQLFPDTVYGVPEGATKTALIASYKLAKASPWFAPGSHVLAMGRVQEKKHGDPKDRAFVGTPRGKTLVLEDVTTSGGSLLRETQRLKQLGIDVVGVLTLTDRDEKVNGTSVAEIFQKSGLPFYRMSHALTLLPAFVKTVSVKPEILRKIEAGFRDFGLAALQW